MMNCMKKHSEVEVKFDRDNLNAILVKHRGELKHMIAIPPSTNRCDLFDVFKPNNMDGVESIDPFNYNGIVVIQSAGYKSIWQKGEILDHVIVL